MLLHRDFFYTFVVMKILRAIIFSILLLCNLASLHAVTRVSWLTCWPGDDVYELEGHSALRIKTDSTDYVVNWGLFDFNAPAFVWRFALGETDYMVGAHPTALFVGSYIPQHRRVTEQELDIDCIATARLVALIDSTLRPGANTYRYNYVLDNCSTRPLDYLQKAISDSIIISESKSNDASTFRSEMKRYHELYPWYQLGIDLALGSDIDRPISIRQQGFAPVKMMELLRLATYTNGRPLVKSESTLYPGEDAPGQSPALVTPWMVSIVIALVALAALICDIRRRRCTKWLISAFFSLEFLAGCLITFLVFISSHYATSPNWILLWLNPLAILPAVGIWTRKASGKTLYTYFTLNIVAVIILGTIFAIGKQCGNITFLPLMATSIMLSLDYIIVNIKNRN